MGIKKKKDRFWKDRFVKVGTLKSGKDWFVIGENQAREIISKHKLKVDKRLFKMKGLDINIVRYKEQDVCLWFTPRDDENAKRFDIPIKLKERGNLSSLSFGLNKTIFNKYKMNGIDCGEILLTIYG